MIRSTIDQFLVIIGVIIIVVPVALMEDSGGALLTVMGGIAVMALGVWRLGHRVLPERRVYVGLRSEVDHFIGLVRKLNTSALQGGSDRVAQVKASMHDSVDRMALIAGMTELDSEDLGAT